MNQYTQRAHIDRVIEDGLNAVIRHLVREQADGHARVIVASTDRIRREIADRLQAAFTIRTPRKR